MRDLLTRLRSYANSAPLNVMTPGQIQRDLWAIAGDPHEHRLMIGTNECLLCGQDRDAAVHHANFDPPGILAAE